MVAQDEGSESGGGDYSVIPDKAWKDTKRELLQHNISWEVWAVFRA